jgi:hypothetical protein
MTGIPMMTRLAFSVWIAVLSKEPKPPCMGRDDSITPMLVRDCSFSEHPTKAATSKTHSNLFISSSFYSFFL